MGNVISLIGFVITILVVLLNAYLTIKVSRKVERLKASLSKEVIEHEIVFTKWHNDRVAVVEGLYKLLLPLKEAFVRVLIYEEPDDGNDPGYDWYINELDNHRRTFMSYYKEHLPYLGEFKEIVEQFDRCTGVLRKKSTVIAYSNAQKEADSIMNSIVQKIEGILKGSYIRPSA
ncbi:MAG: hypothetical protein ABFD54_15510 [Armatimonadota bacterium]|nr:hypothetical protein [bacterium]